MHVICLLLRAHSTCVPPTPRNLHPRLQLFLAKVTRHIPEDAVAAVLGQYGQVESLRMFKPTPDAVFHKVGGWMVPQVVLPASGRVVPGFLAPLQWFF